MQASSDLIDVLDALLFIASFRQHYYVQLNTGPHLPLFVVPLVTFPVLVKFLWCLGNFPSKPCLTILSAGFVNEVKKSAVVCL